MFCFQCIDYSDDEEEAKAKAARKKRNLERYINIIACFVKFSGLELTTQNCTAQILKLY